MNSKILAVVLATGALTACETPYRVYEINPQTAKRNNTSSDSSDTTEMLLPIVKAKKGRITRADRVAALTNGKCVSWWDKKEDRTLEYRECNVEGNIIEDVRPIKHRPIVGVVPLPKPPR